MAVIESPRSGAQASALALLGGKPTVSLPFPRWPQFDETEVELLRETVTSGEWWSMSGSQVHRFEEAFAHRHGALNALCVTNGTHAIELALRTLGVGPGDEVIVPSLTFVATAMPVFTVGARPVPVDVDPESWCLDPEAVRAALNERTRLIVPVHFAGHVAAMDRLGSLADEVGVPILEDAAHAHGASRCARPAGSLGILAAFSFQNYKLMAAGEGGILLFNSPELHRRALLISNCGRPPGDTAYRHDELGSNFRMSEFQAAVLNAQLTRLDDNGARREANAAYLGRRLREEVPEVRLQGRAPEITRHGFYMYVFTLAAGAFGGLDRDSVVRALVAEGLPAFRLYPRIEDTGHFAPALRRVGGDPTKLPANPVSWHLADRGIWLHHRVLLGSPRHADQVVAALLKVKQQADVLRGASQSPLS